MQPSTVPAPHTFRNSLERTSKSKIWPIRRWGGEANSNPWYMIKTAVYELYHVRDSCSMYVRTSNIYLKDYLQ